MTARTDPADTALEARLRELAGAVADPELPVLTLAELGVLRELRLLGPGRVDVELTPTYTGCPAIGTMSADIARVLHEHGIPEVTVRTVLAPAWSTDDITAEGRRKLAEFGIAPPRRNRTSGPVPVPVELGPIRRRRAAAPAPAAALAPAATAASTAAEPEPVRCPQCGSADTVLLSRFSSTACKALRRCESCREPFDHFKEI